MITRKTSRKNIDKKSVKDVNSLNCPKKKSVTKNPPELKVKLIPTDIRSL